MAKGSKKGACSSNTQAAKANCLAHDRREGKVPSYVNPHLTNTNRVVFEDELVSGRKSIVPLVKKAEKEYTEKTGQKVQASFAAFRESVLHLRSGISDEQLLQFKTQAESLTGWKCVGIYLHQDEGHVHSKYIEGDEDFDINYHAHVLWDCQDHQTGKSIKCTRSHLSKMQDLLAEATGMERGNKASETGRTHRSAQEQRIIAQQERIEQLELECKKAKEREEKAKEAEKKAREKEIWANGRTREAEKKAREAVLAANTKRGALMMRDGGRFLVGSLAYLGGSIAYLGGSLTSNNGRNMAKMTRDNIRLQDEVNALKKQVEDTGKKADAWKHMWNEDRRVQESIAKHVPEVRSLLNLWTRIKTVYRMVVSGEWFAAALDGRKQNYTGPLYLNEQKINTSGGMELYLNAKKTDLAFAGRDLQDIAEQLRQDAEKKAQEKAAERQKWEREQEERRETARQEQETRSIGRGFRR